MPRLATLALALSFAGLAQAQPAPDPLEVRRNASRPSAAGEPANFTGRVRIDNPFEGRAPSRVSGSTVTFEPGARTAWHSHPLGQILIVTQGCGLVQAEGGAVTVIRPGDVVWTPPGVRHWHGASPAAPLTHVAIAESVDGRRVTWMEQVPDAHYAANARSASCS